MLTDWPILKAHPISASNEEKGQSCWLVTEHPMSLFSHKRPCHFFIYLFVGECKWIDVNVNFCGHWMSQPVPDFHYILMRRSHKSKSTFAMSRELGFFLTHLPTHTLKKASLNHTCQISVSLWRAFHSDNYINKLIKFFVTFIIIKTHSFENNFALTKSFKYCSLMIYFRVGLH